ncbi:putative Short-chain dehydrogenase [Pleurostoma richardsiae]|uniref:Short-chain dehydrogenase n=1 Tax=Pleurostoma richardsiae TaxID=41990 RepID=A0AA38RZG5_9PEZI|nr:putative Short-chain dehydrogenase [Pleurostoma richardsiae]
MPGFLDFVREQRTPLPLVPTPADVSGGTYIVTGSNTGLGYECAKHLVRLGATRVILAVRSPSRGAAALASIRKETGKPAAGEVWELDLTSLASVEAFAARLAALDRLDALIESAGIARRFFELVEGLESSLTVNVLGTFLLAMRAIPKLRESAKKFGIQPHVAIVTSETGFMMKPRPLEGVKSNVFETLSDEKTAIMPQRYPLSKLMQIYAGRELASLLPLSDTGVVINLVNPGLCSTELARESGWTLMRLQIEVMRRLVGRTAEEGSRTLLHGAFAGPESHGKYLSACTTKDDKNPSVPEWLYNDDGVRTQKQVWADLIDILERKGHHVDIAALKAGH